MACHVTANPKTRKEDQNGVMKMGLFEGAFNFCQNKIFGNNISRFSLVFGEMKISRISRERKMLKLKRNKIK